MKLLCLLVLFVTLATAGCESIPFPFPYPSAPPPAANIDELDIAIRDASDYLNANIPRGSKIVILNIESISPALSEYVIDELIANAVNDRVFTVVDRQQLDAIRTEQNFQLSGEVDDNDALSIGRFFGAQTIVSGGVNRLGAGYRIRIRALEVQTAQVQGQYNRNISASAIVTSLMASSSSPSGGTTPGASTTPGAQSQTPANTPGGTPPAVSPRPAEPSITGTMVPGTNLAAKLTWLRQFADSRNTYIIELNSDETIAPATLEYSGAANVTVVLRGDGQNRTVSLASRGSMFTVSRNVTFVLDNNVTLVGRSENYDALVTVAGGTFRMNTGSVITGNENDNYSMGILTSGGVYVSNRGTFVMSGGVISGNSAYGGGGVYVGGNSTFTMSGGAISGNIGPGFSGYVISTNGLAGGVCVIDDGTFTMSGGVIEDNATGGNGGGVLVETSGTFVMSGGAISGNSAGNSGGGVYVLGTTSYRDNFTMRGGTISGNTARGYGGGVYVDSYARFTKTGGTITGYNSDQVNGNAVRDANGEILGRRGHAVGGDSRKETTAGPEDNLSFSGGTASGAWDG